MNLNQQINHLYEQYAVTLKQYDIFIVREDATIVFYNRDKSQDKASLIVSSWKALREITNDSKADQDFRLSFDISSQGVFVLCFVLFEQRFFASILYEDIVNPGLLKKNFKSFVTQLKTDLIYSQSSGNLTESRKSKNSKFLFQDISDDELDRVFSDLRGDHVIC